MAKKMKTMDGNQAAAEASYALTEIAAIFPITPSSPMAETVDEWSAHQYKNIFDQPVKVVEMESEAGAAAAVHGSLQAGALTTTYTASQGLLLMIPEMFRMAGNLVPAVFHVSARALATESLSIFGDHQDINATRQTGFTLLCSNNGQEAMDLAYISHLLAIKSRVPVLHFFDGFRTSHEVQKIEVTDFDLIAKLVDHQKIQEFRDRSLNPNHPVLRGTAKNPDIYFQGREVANPFTEAVPDILADYFTEFKKLTGREYRPFEYYGSPDAEEVIVAMGSVCNTIEETIDFLGQRGEKLGLIKVHLYRPFSKKYFFDVLPKNVKRIAVLDRTKEPGSTGEPLYLDVIQVYNHEQSRPIIVGGRYGLGSKDTTPSHILAVYRNLKKTAPKDRFTVGIKDDVGNTSLPEEEVIDASPKGTIRCKFWGLGSDGTVGANKSAIKIIGDNTDLYVQGYFEYDSKKSGGTTISHLRFGKEPIKSSYLVFNADYVACHNKSFINHYDLLEGLKDGGTFVLNCSWRPEEIEAHLPASYKRYLVRHRIQFYIIDAISIAEEIGLGGRINMVMQAAFFKLAEVIPLNDAIRYLKDSIQEVYGRKGTGVVEMNWRAVDRGIEALQKVEVPAAWADIPEETMPVKDEPDFIKKIQRPMARHKGDELPTSAFLGMEDGAFPLGTTKYEKRGIAVYLPEWQIDKCIQCNQCSFICPHATIRPFLLNDEEKAKAPDTFKTKAPNSKKLEGHHYRIQVSPLDCTGCGNCADICPAPGKALVMKPADHEIEMESENWEFAMRVTEKRHLMDVKTLIGSQFARPLLEFNGACPGCGETPYARLITQLYGDRMIITNATGCSSIWGGSAPSIPYTANAEGRGPAWMNPLFEDNAQFGYGVYLGSKQIREKIAQLMNQCLETNLSEELKQAFREWLDNFNDGDGSKKAADHVLKAMKKEDLSGNVLLREILARKHYLIKPSVWIFGGDGFAYDIGYNGVDHVLASGDDVNILVMDTEVYSNTGGQASKATPLAAVAKFAAGGKKIRKKDLGLIATTYGYVYVAQIAMGANMNQAIKAISEAESYKGPSLIIAYSSCVNHGIKSGMGTSIAEMKKAVESGYWHLWRFDPRLKDQGKNPFNLDSKEPTGNFRDFLMGEVRYASLMTLFPEIAEKMFAVAEEHAKEKFRTLKRLADIQ